MNLHELRISTAYGVPVRCPKCGHQDHLAEDPYPDRTYSLECGSCRHIWIFQLIPPQRGTNVQNHRRDD